MDAVSSGAPYARRISGRKRGKKNAYYIIILYICIVVGGGGKERNILCTESFWVQKPSPPPPQQRGFGDHTRTRAHIKYNIIYTYWFKDHADFWKRRTVNKTDCISGGVVILFSVSVL